MGWDGSSAGVAALLPGFVLEELLGRGGFAEVWAARDAGGQEVAIKLARRAVDERFEREASALARVGAPATCTLEGRGTAVDGRPYLVLERLRGRTLTHVLAGRPGGKMAPREASEWIARIAAALTPLHAAGLVHRDLKPDNLFACDDGRLVLLDLGLARVAERAAGDAHGGDFDDPSPSLTRTGEQLGTPPYMAPEQCAGAKGIDARTDVYALGCVLFECLTGRPPFLGDSAMIMRAHLSMRPPRVSQLAAGVGEAMDVVVARALAKAPAERHESVMAVAEAVTVAAAETVAAAAADTVAGAVADTVAGTAAAAAAETVVVARPERRSVTLVALRGDVAADQLAQRAAALGGEVALLRPELAVLAFADDMTARRAATILAPLASGPPLLHRADVRVLPSGALAVPESIALAIRRRAGDRVDGAADGASAARRPRPAPR